MARRTTTLEFESHERHDTNARGTMGPDHNVRCQMTKKGESFGYNRWIYYRMWVISQILEDRLEEYYRSNFALTRSQWRILSTLSFKGSLTASELAQWTNQDKTRVSQCLAELSEGGLLSRTKDKEDGRRVTIKLLPKGKRLFARISPKAQELETELFSILSPAEQNALSGLMDRLQAWAFQFTKSGKPF